jgi:hypothetical protein
MPELRVPDQDAHHRAHEPGLPGLRRCSLFRARIALWYAKEAQLVSTTLSQRPMKTAHLLRSVARRLIPGLAPIVVLALCLASCMDKGQATARPRGEPTTVAGGTTAAGEPTGANLTSDRKGTGEGWRWKGNRAHCMFLVGKQCFDKRETACEAAGCTGDACEASSAVPAQVSCQGK